MYRHKALLYLSAETVFLLLLLFVVALQGDLRVFWTISLPNALVCLALPWGIMAGARYLPVNGWLRASCVSVWMGIWLWLAPAVFEMIMLPVYGESDKPYALAIPFDFTRWDFPYKAWNIIMIILMVLGAAAVFFGYMGLRKEKKRRQK